MSARYTGGLVYNAPGGWSGYFDGSGDYLTAPDNAVFDFGSGNFTLEAIVFPLTSTPSSSVFGKRASGAVYAPFVVGFGGTLAPQLLVSFNGSTWGINFSSSFSCIAQTWNHIAVTRNGSTFTIWVNGQSGGTASSASAVMTNTTAVSIGATAADGTSSFNGYISNARIVKGTAVYTANFTPPTGALVPISGTSLLTCAYSTFRDGSTNNFTVTANGNTAVSNVNPFPTSQLPNPALGGAGNGVYTMSQYAALKAANLWPAYDPYYSNVTLNLHGNGTNAAQNNTFLDSSTNNFTITRNGNTTQGTFSPYGSNWSNNFNGSSGVTVSSTSSQFSFSGDFTWEAWVNPSALPSSGGSASIICSRGSVASNSAFQFFLNNNSGTYRVGATISVSSTDYGPLWDIPSAPALGVWYHVAVVRSGSTVQAYWNGAAIGSAQTASGTTNTPTVNPTIGFRGGAYNDLFFNGYISNFRMVGSAVYTSNFTPPTAPLTAISGTRLLTCADNRFIDDSTNAFALTAYSSPTVQRFSPFVSATEYSTSTIGGSGYFDGSGDSLKVAYGSQMNLTNQNFAIEFWIYLPAQLSNRSIVCQDQSNYQLNAYVDSGGNLTFYSYQASGTENFNVPMGATPVGAWTHLVIARTGSTVAGFRNGTRIATATFAGTIDAQTGGWYIGAVYSNINQMNGYLSDVRFVIGSNPYGVGTTLTVPTAPLTAITNTQFLSNMTNAAIIDNAMMSNLETVGNAQISTSIKKYGTGSIAFDGTDDRLTAASSPNIAFGTGDFTIEGWFYINSGSPNNGALQISGTTGGLQANTTTNIAIFSADNSGTKWGAYYANTFAYGSASTTQTWTHIALVRSSGSLKLYINGTADATFGTKTDTTNYTGQNICVGGYYSTSYLWNGYIDDLRITKGVARYTTNFTPPTSQVQDQ
jgi:hypothetical protein